MALFAKNRQTPPSASTELIELTNIVKTYESGGKQFTALKGASVSIGRSEFVAIIGKSGSGKSTLLNMMSGIDRPTSGEVNIAGTAIHLLSENELALWRGKHLGIVFQFFQLLPTLTLIENVMLPMDFCRTYNRRQRFERAMHLLKIVEMDHQAHKLPSEVSGGQQQRVAIARSLANDPPILLADEPTGNLDSRTAEAIFAMFETLVADGKTIVMVTHDNEQADRVKRAITIADGEIVSDVQMRKGALVTA